MEDCLVSNHLELEKNEVLEGIIRLVQFDILLNDYVVWYSLALTDFSSNLIWKQLQVK